MTLPDTVHSIYGHLSANEAELLYKLASEVPAGGTIVEIGSFQGKSTVCLGLGAKQAGARVYAIDPHEDMQVNAETHYGMENHAALLKNLVEFEVAEVVRLIGLRSSDAYYVWVEYPVPSIHLLWIDGNHEEYAVAWDISMWSRSVKAEGKIVLHDTSGHFPGVLRALKRFLDGNTDRWHVAQTVDAITVLDRIL